MKNWKIDDIVDTVVTTDEMNEYGGKPSPEPIKRLCAKYKLRTSDVIMVGDTTGDTLMAKNANVGLCLGVLSGSGTAEQLISTGASMVIPDVGYVGLVLQEFRNNYDEVKENHEWRKFFTDNTPRFKSKA